MIPGGKGKDDRMGQVEQNGQGEKGPCGCRRLYNRCRAHDNPIRWRLRLRLRLGEGYGGGEGRKEVYWG
eukprot:1333831-Alexandrium_andersonii.AAC.1